MDKEKNSVFEIARKFSCFRLVSDGDLRTVLRYGRPAEYRRQRALCYQSEPARNLFLILSGRVTRLKYRADESCVVFGRGEEGDWMGIAEVLLGSPYLTDVIAEGRTEALVFSAKAVGEVLKISTMKDTFLQYLAKSLFLLHSQMELNLPLPRIIQYILVYSQRKDDGSAVLSVTQDEIAQAVGVTRETVNKYLQILQADGIIQVGRGNLQIPDCEALGERIIA
jgi:CRP-like cAMP-binding protein